MGDLEVRRFLTDLAEKQSVSASTQNQALNALVFLYREVLQSPLGKMEAFVRAKRPKNLPIVLTKGAVQSVLKQMEGVPRLVALLVYGSGLRLLECLTLRVKDLDFERMEIRVRRGKGGKDRLWAAAHNLSYVPGKVMCSGRRQKLRRQAPGDDCPAHNYLPLNEAMSLSAGRKRPGFRVGGRTVSNISRFWEGSARRYASVL